MLRLKLAFRCISLNRRDRLIKLEELTPFIPSPSEEPIVGTPSTAIMARLQERPPHPRTITEPLFRPVFDSISTKAPPRSRDKPITASLEILGSKARDLATSTISTDSSQSKEPLYSNKFSNPSPHITPRNRHGTNTPLMVGKIKGRRTSPVKSEKIDITSARRDRLTYVPTSTAQKTFAEMGLPEWLLESLSRRNITQPTDIQQKTIRAIMEDSSGGKRAIYIKAQTGTGKSLGYIIALLAKLHKKRFLQSLVETFNCYHLVLTPNVILGQQLLRWIRQLVGDNVFWSERLGSIVKVALPIEELDDDYPDTITKIGPSHILISTPGKVRELMAKGLLNLRSIEDIVVDEVDAQLKSLSSYATKKEIRMRTKHPVPGFVALKEIYNLCKETHTNPPRLIVASATLNSRCRMDIIKAGIAGKYAILDDMNADRRLTQACPATIKHHFRMLKDAESIDELITLIKGISDGQQETTGVLFVPATKSKTAIQQLLETAKIKTELVSELKVDQVQNLVGTLLVGSDIDARGWDLPSLSYVIIVDLPESPTHYLHMAGRVGRMGSLGTVYTFVAGQKDLERLTNIYSILRLSSTPYLASQ